MPLLGEICKANVSIQFALNDLDVLLERIIDRMLGVVVHGLGHGVYCLVSTEGGGDARPVDIPEVIGLI